MSSPLIDERYPHRERDRRGRDGRLRHAHDRKLGRDVAIKVSPPAFTERGAERFDQEHAPLRAQSRQTSM